MKGEDLDVLGSDVRAVTRRQLVKNMVRRRLLLLLLLHLHLISPLSIPWACHLLQAAGEFLFINLDNFSSSSSFNSTWYNIIWLGKRMGRKVAWIASRFVVEMSGDMFSCQVISLETCTWPQASNGANLTASLSPCHHAYLKYMPFIIHISREWDQPHLRGDKYRSNKKFKSELVIFAILTSYFINVWGSNLEFKCKKASNISSRFNGSGLNPYILYWRYSFNMFKSM